jgi:branched-chain amino acid transport system permease protein
MAASSLVSLLVEAAILIILCIGFTLTYMVEKFPNFGHTAIATIGTLLTYGLVKVWGYDPYSTWLISAAACGLLTLIIYFLIVRPIKAHGTNIITLTFVFFAIAEVVGSFVSIFSYWFLYSQHYPQNGFWLANYDFTWGGYPGIFIVTLPLCMVIVVALYIFLSRVKFGIALRAVAENEQLAAIFGVDTQTIHIFSWFLTGSLAGLAGAIIPLWQYTGMGYSDTFLIAVMAGCLVGGLQSVTGAVVGGFILAVSQNWLILLMIIIFGIGAQNWESIIPSLFIVAILIVEPEGIMGFFERNHTPIRTLKMYMSRLMGLISRMINSS